MFRATHGSVLREVWRVYCSEKDPDRSPTLKKFPLLIQSKFQAEPLRLILFFFLPFSSLQEARTGRTNLQVWIDRYRGRYDASLNTQGGTLGEWCEDVSFLRVTPFTRQWLDNLLDP